MLTHLHIRHFAIIDSSELELSNGMTALTGETGAGKSILLDALGLVLGARASADSIQQGQSRADVTAIFNLEALPDIVAWLSERELDTEDECIIRRTINANGKSRATVNDVPVSVQSLRELGENLVNIHGQHAHQKLARASDQRDLLDQFAGTEQKARVHDAFESWKQANTAFENYENDSVKRAQRLDLVRFQLREFDELDIGTMRIEDIESEHRWLANADRILSLGAEVLAALDEQAHPAIMRSHSPLAELAGIDEQLRESHDLIESAGIQVTEAIQAVSKRMTQLEHDNARLEWLDQKLATLHGLSRKHQCDVNGLNEVEDRLREEHDELNETSHSSDELRRERDALRKIYDLESSKLTRHRKKQAKKLAKLITDSMQELNMPDGVFDIHVDNNKAEPDAHGADTIEFLVSPNPGLKPAPLSRIASGGELSRISLSMQLATLETQSVPTLVFDEVDSGVGGAVAENVGKLLRRVGSRAQVLCVTHLPQVAAQAHNHLKVSKEVIEGKTRTRLAKLGAKATRDEIARMLGGTKITEKSRLHAQEMLDSVS